MIHVFGHAEPPLTRLVAALAARGHEARAASAGDRSAGHATLVLGPGSDLDPAALGVLLGAWRRSEGARVLVVSLLGAHPDAHAARLARLWALEEQVRRVAIPALTVRLAPLVGRESPLWLRLRARPGLPRGGRTLIQPVAEEDVAETLDRALTGRAAWRGWYELAGPRAFTLHELAGLACAAGPRLPFGAGAWEPPLEEMREHRLAEPSPWADHFGIEPTSIESRVDAWAA